MSEINLKALQDKEQSKLDDVVKFGTSSLTLNVKYETLLVTRETIITIEGTTW
jgi:hypothetical protein